MIWKLGLILGFSTAAFLAAARFPLAWIDRRPRLWLRLALAFAVLPLLPGGGHFPVIYPVLVCLMLAAAAWSASPGPGRRHAVESALLAALTLAALLAQPHFWGACAFFGLVLLALAIHGRWQAALILGAIPLAGIGGSLLTNAYRRERILGFLNPENDPYGHGYQLLQNLLVFAAAPGFGPLPDSLAHQATLHGDLTWIAARFGLVAASLFIALIAGIVAFGVWRAARQADPRLRTLGLLMSFALGCWMLVAAAWPLGLIPTASVPLPFVGGFHAAVFAALALGVVHRLSPVAALAPKPDRSFVVVVAVVLGGAGLLLARMWTLQVPPTDPIQLRGRILDAQGIPLTEARKVGRHWRIVYPHGHTAAQVLGLVGSDGRGIEGLQLQYDRVLSGADSKRGNDLRLTIDLRRQKALEAVLQPYLERHGGFIEALVMQPDGAILAAAALPGYDPNQRREMTALMRFRPATDTAQAGPMIRPFHLAHGIETFGSRFLADAPTTAQVADKLGATGLHDALVRFGFDRRPALDFPGTVFGRTYYSLFGPAAKPLTPAFEKEFRRGFSEGWSVSMSQMRYASSFAALVTGSLPEPRLASEAGKDRPAPSPVIQPGTAAALRATMIADVRAAGHENMGGVWATFRPKMPPYPQGDHELRYAMSALFAPAEQPQLLVVVKLSAHGRLPKDLGLEIGARVVEAVK